jgi:hypothetical protein
MGCEKFSVELNSLNLNFLEPVDVVEVALCSMNSPLLWSSVPQVWHRHSTANWQNSRALGYVLSAHPFLKEVV